MTFLLGVLVVSGLFFLLVGLVEMVSAVSGLFLGGLTLFGRVLAVS